MNIKNKVLSLLKNFELKYEAVSVHPYGNGHINDTCLIGTTGGDKYIFQQVNRNVFKEPVKVMKNIEKVTAYLKTRSDGTGKVMSLVPALDGNSYFEDENGNVWRVYEYIGNSICLNKIDNPKDFYECGYAFGNFQNQLNDFPADTLYETIRDFHNTPVRYADFLRSVSGDRAGRVKAAEKEIEFIKERQDFYSCLSNAAKSGVLPLRVTHNDTKSNNVLLDEKTHKALCVIDLDTVMPGYSVNDFGDAVRFGASTAAEDENDLDNVCFDFNLYNAYLKGFLKGCGGKLKNEEIMLMPEGALMMTFECGMRFLSDYLNGDIYFKTAYPEHNLVRARNQLKLAKEMEAGFDTMKRSVNEYCRHGSNCYGNIEK